MLEYLTYTDDGEISLNQEALQKLDKTSVEFYIFAKNKEGQKA